jgi:catalase
VAGAAAAVAGAVVTAAVSAAGGAHAPTGRRRVDRSPALSQANTARDSIRSRRVAVLAADGFDAEAVRTVRTALQAQGAQVEVVSRFLSPIVSAAGESAPVDRSLLTSGSVLYDAVFLPGGRQSVEHLALLDDALRFVAEAFRHGKAIAASGEGVDLLRRATAPFGPPAAPGPGDGAGDGRNGQAPGAAGIVTATPGSPGSGGDLSALATAFVAAIAQHRHWERVPPYGARVPA